MREPTTVAARTDRLCTDRSDPTPDLTRAVRLTKSHEEPHITHTAVAHRIAHSIRRWLADPEESLEGPPPPEIRLRSSASRRASTVHPDPASRK